LGRSIEARTAIEELDEPFRSIVLLHEAGLPVHQIARQIHLGCRKTRRLLDIALKQLAEHPRDSR
jgi:DNA-directed RNA polymerase specialized sigma24 family protein